MKIVDRLPYSTEKRAVSVQGESVLVKPHQIVVWVSVSPENLLEWDPRTPRFPAILDTGNNHNFAIGRGHLLRWAGIDLRLLTIRGAVRDKGKRIPLHAADLWVHPNRPGTQEIVAGVEPYQMRLEDGITVYLDEEAPRLPIMGLRALTVNQLRTLIDGERSRVTIKTPRPRWWPFG